MKCIKLTSSKRIIRCEDADADILVEKGVAKFVGKVEWRADGKNYLSEEDKVILSKLKEKE